MDSHFLFKFVYIQIFPPLPKYSVQELVVFRLIHLLDIFISI